MTTEITKLRNVAGKEYTCACCGRIVIEHPFKTASGLVYGKECITKVLGTKGAAVAKIQITRAQQFSSWSAAQIARSLAAYKMTENEYYEYFIRTGGM